MNDAQAPSEDLGQRTKQYALRIMRLRTALPHNDLGWTIGKQVLRSGTSVGAQYREARRSRSDAEFVSKLQSALQELDETAYWLELLVEGEIVSAERLAPLMDETQQLTSILVASIKTVKNRNRVKQ
jgi:four helix bundle protein